MGLLKANEINKIKQKGIYSDGDGLRLRVDENNNKNWVFRYTMFGKSKDMGLGKFPIVTLNDARQKLVNAKKIIYEGKDPIKLKKEKQIELKRKSITFKKIRDEFIETFEVEWSNSKHKNQWINTLKTYADPIIGDLAPSEIKTHHVLSILKPIWSSKHETASRVRQRLERIFSYCIASDFMDRPNPASLKDNLEFLLPKVSKSLSVQHLRSLDYQDLPFLIPKLINPHTTPSLALALLITTACRTNEVIGSTWNEINLKDKVWVIPAHRMKMRQEHTVPLNDLALRVLNLIEKNNASPFIFLNAKKTTHICNNTMRYFLMKNLPDYFKDTVPHGFRSSFRNWAEENHNYSRRAVELCLAHANKNKVEKAYLRSNLLSKRIEIMNEWNKFLTSKLK
tara:strand:+ start:131 stop:1318 length:1188 start_codon:yes stop_codon:yes gene_type:complete